LFYAEDDEGAEDASMQSGISVASVSTALSESTSGSESTAEHEVKMLQKIFEKMQDLEATWVGFIAAGNNKDAEFIAEQIRELNSFVQTHGDHLGTTMMDTGDGVLLLNALSSDAIFHDKIFPMLKARVAREGGTVKSQFRELATYVKHTLKGTEDASVEEVILHIVEQENSTNASVVLVKEQNDHDNAVGSR